MVSKYAFYTVRMQCLPDLAATKNSPYVHAYMYIPYSELFWGKNYLQINISRVFIFAASICIAEKINIVYFSHDINI